MRQYGEVPPVLSTIAAPMPSVVTGLGTGGGASVFSQDGSGFGYVLIQTGANPNTTWQIQLTFGTSPPNLFISGDDQLGVLQVSQVTTTLTVSSTNATWLPNTKYSLNYEWSASF